MVSTKPSNPKNKQSEGIVLNDRGEEMPSDKATVERTKDSAQKPNDGAPTQPQSPGMPGGGE